MNKKSRARRDFLTGAIAVLVGVPTLSETDAKQAPEVPRVIFIELPPKATFWGVATFLSEDLTEVSIRTQKDSTLVRGRVDGKRLAEFSRRNDSSKMARIEIGAKVLAGDRALSPDPVRYTAEQSCYIGFGRRSAPANGADRVGAYPHDAVVLGFIVFGQA